MKKIMFSERYGLEQAVLRGDKTMTRRLMTMTLHRHNKYGQLVKIEPDDMFIASDGTAHFKFGDKGYTVPKQNQPAYRIGEEVAIAQRYEDAINPLDWVNRKLYQDEKGWSNKMYVKADLMPYRIRITGIKVERLQDISDEDCLREGVYKHNAAPDALGMDRYKFIAYAYNATPGENIKRWWFQTPREAFAALIDRISGRGTWQRNPWVYAYTFELTK